MVLVCRQRRILRIVAFIGVACVIFLCFQLFLVGFLDHSAHLGLQHGAQPKFGLDSDDLRVIDMTDERMKTTERPLQRQHRVESECTSHNCSIAAKLLKTSVLAVSESHVISNASRLPGSFVSNDSHEDSSSELSQFKSVWEFLEHRFSRPFVLEKGISAHFTRGVNSRWQYLYEADDRMQFTCILSQEQIPFAQVNDDYCDCVDSSDEPGTSACPDGRFYCDFQQSENPRWLTSSRVNDGICDCCDGSDEWLQIKLPDHVAVHDGLAHYGLYQSPCSDHCDELRQREEELVAMRLRGLALRRAYLKAGFDNGHNEELYGPGAVFYKLSAVCLETSVGKYSYSVCPFGSVKQTEHGRLPVVIGSRARWLDRGPSVYRLLLDDGDSTNCPDGRHRQTTVKFECGDKDHVITLTENEVCQYIVNMMTPAAC